MFDDCISKTLWNLVLGLRLVEVLLLPGSEILPYVFKVSFGAFLAFAMELSEYLVVTYTSSLTLSITGIFKVKKLTFNK